MRASLIMAAAALLLTGRPLPAQAPEQPEPAGEQEVRSTTRIEQLVGSIDLERIAEDPALGEGLLRMFESNAAQEPPDSAGRARFDGMRAMLLAVMRRRAESEAIIDRIVARGFPEPSAYEQIWSAAGLLGDGARMVSVAEAAVRNVPAAERGSLNPLFDAAMVDAAIGAFEERGDHRALARLLEALAAIGWPGESNPNARDRIRLRLVDARLLAGNRTGAAEVARRIASPAQTLLLVVLKRYEGLLPDAADGAGLVRHALDGHDRATARIAADRPADAEAIFGRAQLLLSTGRPVEVLALLQPWLNDVARTVSSQPLGMWLIDQAAYALLALGRAPEGARLYARLVALPVEERPALLDLNINYAGYLWQAGHYREALVQAERLTRDLDGRMNDFGRLWTFSARVCALAGLDRAAEARLWLARMRPISAANPGALMRAYLCLGDMDSAEAMMIERLRSASPTDAVLALQDWQVAEAPGGPAPTVEARLAELRARPAVARELARVGRVMSLPMGRSYWGSF